MRPLVRSPKDFGAGLVYVVFGVAAVWIGRDYPFGTGARMGPGYFPSVLGGLLVLFGLAGLAAVVVAVLASPAVRNVLGLG